MDDSQCVRERLAGATGIQVDQCRCGCVHVTLGAVTLRVQPDVLIDVVRVLEAATVELERRREPQRVVADWVS